MSKGITPKDALEMIQDNITPRTLAILTVEFNIVEKALDRLEQLEKENQELETDKKMLNALYQEVKDTASFYMSKCEKFEKVIKILKDKVTFRWRNDDILEIVKYIWQNNSPRIEILTNYEEDELLKEFLENV